jgi:hypothetical protein
VILLGLQPKREAREQFESVTIAATLENPYAYRYENRPILFVQRFEMESANRLVES